MRTLLRGWRFWQRWRICRARARGGGRAGAGSRVGHSRGENRHLSRRFDPRRKCWKTLPLEGRGASAARSRFRATTRRQGGEAHAPARPRDSACRRSTIRAHPQRVDRQDGLCRRRPAGSRRTGRRCRTAPSATSSRLRNVDSGDLGRGPRPGGRNRAGERGMMRALLVLLLATLMGRHPRRPRCGSRT